MAWARKRDGVKGRVFCLMGDGEVAEGSVWEAAQFASFYALDRLVAIVDVNRLGQSGPTMLQHDMGTYEARFRAFGWDAIVVDGHDIPALQKAFKDAEKVKGKPVVLLAKTHKGRGVSFVEDKEGWHGRPFKKGDEEKKALAELGDTTIDLKVEPRRYSDGPTRSIRQPKVTPKYTLGQEVATREAYGSGLAQIGADCLDVVALDGDTKNSTFSEKFKEIAPDRFADAYIAEQNMVGAALGMATEGKIPFASTFACFMGRAYDFIRMAALSKPKHLVLCGSHAGVSIGEDGASQMALEDIAMMRAIIGATVLYPSDAVSTERLIEAAARTPGVVYIRTSRPKTKVLYGNDEFFPIGQSKTLRSSKADRATVVGAGVTVHEALAAYDILAKEAIPIRVIDLYSVKPIDVETLRLAATETKHVVSVEDHAVWGGIGEAVSAAVDGLAPVTIVGVHDTPRSGKPSELMHAHGLDAASIVATVRSLLK
jgi:transketolase